MPIFKTPKKSPLEEGYRGRFTDEIPPSSQQEGYQGRLSGLNLSQHLAITIPEEETTSNVKEESNHTFNELRGSANTWNEKGPNRESLFLSSFVGKAQSNLHRLA